jgi:hypothetical protein
MRKSCTFWGSEIAKKRVCIACFLKIAKRSFSSENDVRNEEKQKKRKMAKRSEKRGNLIEKQKAHEKIGQL